MKLKKEKEKGPVPLPTWCGGTLFDLIDARTDLSPQAYVLRFATAEDWEETRTWIMGRRKTLPAFWWWGCACGFTEKRRGDDSKERPCPKCGKATTKLSLEEANAAQAAYDEGMRKISEQGFRAALFTRNQDRQTQGLFPLTEEEFREERRREAELRSERARGRS